MELVKPSRFSGDAPCASAPISAAVSARFHTAKSSTFPPYGPHGAEPRKSERMSPMPGALALVVSSAPLSQICSAPPPLVKT